MSVGYESGVENFPSRHIFLENGLKNLLNPYLAIFYKM